ncbi:MAG: shikimate dehydrogenase [Verrucomicrobia bacterium]|nr:shikimate dehydrogenase [Verrucomicrobiota bacterium]
MLIDGSTRIVGVFGHPIQHTASPAMHNAAFDHLGLNWRYLAFDVHPDNLRGALRGICDLNFVGVNLTVPHKLLAFKMVDSTDKEAQLLGAVNTVVVEDHKLTGFNTDGYGFKRAVREEFGMELRGRRVLILGAGGAGRALAVQCAVEGAAAIFIVNRTHSKAVSAVAEIRKLVPHTFAVAMPMELKHIAKHLNEVDLVVNATSLGLRPGDPPPLARFPRQCKWLRVYDTIYRPAETRFLAAARKAGAQTANGLSMLLHQGARSFEIWTGRRAPVAVMRRALHKAVYG